MLSMSNAGQHNPFRRRVAAQFVRDDHAWAVRRGTQQLAEEPDASKSVPSWLDENIEDDTVLGDRSPEIVGDSVDLEEDFIQMPLSPLRARRLRRPAACDRPNLSPQRRTVSQLSSTPRAAISSSTSRKLTPNRK